MSQIQFDFISHHIKKEYKCKKSTIILDYFKEHRYSFFVGRLYKPGTGCVTMINDHLYEGRFAQRVNGKRISKNVYVKTREECEEKLAELIKAMKAEIAEMKKATNA